MRYLELITEAGTLDTYKPMFNQIIPFLNNQELGVLDTTIKKYRKVFGSRPAVTWALKQFRVGFVEQIISNREMNVVADRSRNEVNDAEAQNTIENLKRIQKTYQRDTALHTAFTQYDLQRFEHFYSLPIEKIQNYQYGNTAPKKVLDDFSTYEKEWIRTRKARVTPQEGDEKLIDFHNGYAWFILNRGACREEGNAMGHCGNVPSEKEGDRILSLRRHVRNNQWSPLLTFILHEGGYLGEMKGRGNDKPAARFHDMIIALLDHEIVRGIVGGGYESQKNFAITDLPAEDAARVLEMKMGFRSMQWLFDNGYREDALEMLASQIGQARVDEIKGFRDAETVILEQYSSETQYIERNAGHYDRLFDKIEKGLESKSIRVGEGRYITAEHFYDQFREDYFINTFKEHWYHIIDYALGDIMVDFSDEQDGPVMITLPIRDIVDLADEDAAISPHESLTSARDYGVDWSDIKNDDFLDEIDELIMKWLTVNIRREQERTMAELLDAIVYRYAEKDERNDTGSRTERHPDQLELDL